jgi:hypothetical protein
MKGKLTQALKTIVLHRAQQLASTTATFGDILDTQDADQAMIVLNVGKVFGSTTLGAVLYESDVKSRDTMCRVTSGIFPLISSGTGDQAVHVANILCKNYKRYLMLALSAGAYGSPTIGVAATAILGKQDVEPTASPTADFDLVGPTLA